MKTSPVLRDRDCHVMLERRLRYTIVECLLDRMLVAATDKGIAAAAFGALESELEDDLAARFPLAVHVRDDEELGREVGQVLSLLTEHPTAQKISLDVRATAFQARVWQVLLRIPRGETKSYAEVAAEIGQPAAVRAVARACASNPVAVVVPCHRVVGADGRLTGYRWGLERKERLLALEKA